MNMRNILAGAAFLVAALPASSWAANATVPGRLIVDPPTLISLGFAWPIEGDDNRNASVKIEYRASGEEPWRNGLDLLRTQREEMFLRFAYNVTLPNQFAGSLFDLSEDTEHECD
ncbi:MAG: hypothetical protein IPH71_15970 [Proteobacteria bacterium]|nr:hypothetical protein [Pseudomonadota bacterium]